MYKHIFIYNLFLIALLSFSCEKEKYHTDSPTEYDKEILDAMNVYRASKGLKPFLHNDTLWREANLHSENMANNVVPFGHEGLTERSNLVLLELGNGEIAENIATGQGTADEIIKSWLASIGHKMHIEGNFTLTGISAVKIKDGTYYYTQIFYRKNP